MKMFKNILVLGFLLLSITALSRAQDETATDAAEPAADVEPKAADAANPDDEAPAADKKSKGKGKSSDSTVVDDILTFMKATCEKIIEFISGKADGAVAGKAESDDEAETTTEGAVVEETKAKAGKKTKKTLEKILKTKDKDSDESEE